MCICMRAKCLKLHPFVRMQKYLLLLLSKYGLHILLIDNTKINISIVKFALKLCAKWLLNGQIKEENNLYS